MNSCSSLVPAASALSVPSLTAPTAGQLMQPVSEAIHHLAELCGICSVRTKMMQPWKSPPWLTTSYLPGSFKEKGKRTAVCRELILISLNVLLNLDVTAHASTAFWISLGKWLHIRVIPQEKCKCCTHLRNTVILSVRVLTLAHLVVQIYIYIWGNPYMSSISTNPLRNIHQKHFPFTFPFYFLPHRFWNMVFIFRALRKLRTFSWLIMDIHRHKKTDFLFPVSTTTSSWTEGQSDGTRCQNFSC